MTKRYKERLFLLGPEWNIRVWRMADGDFSWRWTTEAGYIIDYTPTTEDWAALALKISEYQDNDEHACWDTLEAIQDEPDPDKKLALAIEFFAEGCDAKQCTACKRWTDSTTEFGHGKHSEHLCEGCAADAYSDMMPCEAKGCRGCMACIGVPSTGPI